MRALQGRVSVMALAPQNQLGETTQGRAARVLGSCTRVGVPGGAPASARPALAWATSLPPGRGGSRCVGRDTQAQGRPCAPPSWTLGRADFRADTLARTPAAGPPQAPPRPPRAGAGACRPSLAAGLGLRRAATRRRGGGAPLVTCPRTCPARAQPPTAPAPPPPPGAIAVGVRSPVRTAWLCRGDPSALWQEGCGGGCGRGSGRREDIRSVKMEEQGMPERLAEVNSQNARLLLKLLEKDKEVRKLRRELEKKAQQDQLDLLCAQMESQLQLHEGGSNLAAAYLRVSRVRPGPQDAAIPAPSSGAQGQGESCKSEPTPPEVAAAG